ncbi:MAG: GMC family oxidoreductase [Sorangiineae bacterium]|nr:GMC family oxidoreductase [Polyangiaceae bacterium]MEB2323822.1 GMC family oxidoreductase [Sorangiineae bacterium]
MTGALVTGAEVRGRRRVEDAADVVIIGSGAAGATAARVLVEAGLEVVLLEEGPRVESRDFRSDMYTTFRHLWRDMGFQVASGRAFTPVLQGRCVGGTTVVNGAIIHRIPAPILGAWRDEYGVGEPFTPAAMERVYDALDRELFVDRAPEEVLGENAKLMRKGVRALGWTGNEIRRNVKDCAGSAHCNQGCPTDRKQSMNVSYIPRALAGGARLYADARAERFLVEGGRAAGVTGRFTGDGPPFRVRARRGVVVAASAIQTPRLLADNGVGRASRLVGERLQAHPGTGTVGLFDAPVELWFGATQGYESLHFWDERMKFETVSMPLEFAAARFPGVGAELMREIGDYGHAAIWGVQVRARAHGRVGRSLFGAPSIHYDMTDEDVRVLKLGVRRLVELMFAAGAREVLPGVHGLPARIRSMDELAPLDAVPNDPRHFHTIAAHLFGTAKMGRGAAQSVVGPELEAHDLPGLYVFDSSVFPTNLGVNPQHTICAVAWLAAERLAERAAH